MFAYCIFKTSPIWLAVGPRYLLTRSFTNVKWVIWITLRSGLMGRLESRQPVKPHKVDENNSNWPS